MKLASMMVCAGLLAACSSTPTPPADAPEATAAPSASAVAAAMPTEAPPSEPAQAATAQASAAPKDEDMPPLSKPKSKYTLGKKSVSDVDWQEMLEIFKKAKLTDASGVGSVPGHQYESMSVPIAKGKMKGRFYMVRPAAGPTPAKSSLADPTSTASMTDKDTAAGIFDKDADVYVEVKLDEGGKAADAKKILESVIKKGK